MHRSLLVTAVMCAWGCGSPDDVAGDDAQQELPLTISPTIATVAVSGTLQFTANVAGVTWSVASVAGGNATVGTITAGTFTAPAVRPNPVIVDVTATSPGGQTASAQVTITAPPIAYITNKTAISIWDDIDVRHGDVAPSRSFPVASPVECVVDRVSDQIWVSELEGDQVQRFTGAASLDGMATAAATTPMSFVLPEGLALTSTGELWVGAVGASNDIVVYNATTLAMLRSFRDPAFTSMFDRRMRLDEAHHRLYMIDLKASSMLIFDTTNPLSGDVTGVQVPTGVAQPWGIAVDTTRDILYVANNQANAEAKVVVFDHASQLGPDSTPARTLQINTTSELTQLNLDEIGDRLAVGTYGGVRIYDNASTSDGAVTPTYVIEGAATTLENQAFGACIDWGR